MGFFLCYLNVCVCKLLIENGENKNPASHHSKEIPLHFAAQNGHSDVCCFLMKIVEENNSANFWRQTPLHLAAKRGHLDVCRIILENITDKNPVDTYGHTPKEYAVQMNDPELLELFEY